MGLCEVGGMARMGLCDYVMGLCEVGGMVRMG